MEETVIRWLTAQERRSLKRLDLPAAAPVFQPGDACQGLPVVLAGCVRVEMTGASGHRIVLYRMEESDLCTLSIGCLMTGRGYRAEAVVEERATAVLIPRAVFRSAMARSDGFRQAVMAAYGRRLDDLMMLVEEVAFHRMDERLREWLAERRQKRVLNLTHQAVAVELGTAREVVSRLLKEMEKQGWVRLSRGTIEVLPALWADHGGG
ncbi:Crp/Fnr family transcriptional regulator [Tamilnaduibacter salinus]|uniref:Crp/Fnr family transcriptional regulator n=1 Tax=Tamilnaduibacter salinus TaxID=1484056 RepID=A0A2A2HYW0_9GAMM|nr:Crp/Fnr family transcriptional regulator [Tamilnaduibacter salinus]PAV24741.1 Crp/Fnr family transcriptional regulator [Tamilnaduibacter salinus]